MKKLPEFPRRGCSAFNTWAVSQIQSQQKNQKVLFSKNDGNSIYVLFWSSVPRNKLKYGKGKKGALYGRKMRFFQIQHGCLDSTLYLGQWKKPIDVIDHCSSHRLASFVATHLFGTVPFFREERAHVLSFHVETKSSIYLPRKAAAKERG